MRNNLPNQPRASIEELCTRYDNEDVHTRHVTGLALRLFDETHSWLGLPASDRALVEAAAALHDVGFRVNPRRHPEVSAEIVLRDGLRGFRETQRQVIATAILFHSGKWKPMLEHRLVRQATDPQRVQRIGAFVRVADGLDFGHIQDAAIVSVRRLRQTIRVTVRSDLFASNLARADAKADLWRCLFPPGVEFTRATTPPERISPLVGAGMIALEAARRLLFFHYKRIVISLDGAIDGASTEPLHCIRVSIRRLRSLLRVYRKQLPSTFVCPIDQGLDELGEALGPARDLDVWLDFLRSDAVRRMMDGNRRWRTFLEYHLQARQLELLTVRRYLQGARFNALRLKMTRLLRAELPRLIRVTPLLPLEPLAVKEVRKTWRKVLKRAHLRCSSSAGKLHKLRITLRRTRYLCEFFGPALGPPVDTFARKLRKTEHMLGRVHDVDMALLRLKLSGPPPPRLLLQHLKERREESLAQIQTAWDRLEAPKLQKPLEDLFKRLTKGD